MARVAFDSNRPILDMNEVRTAIQSPLKTIKIKVVFINGAK